MHKRANEGAGGDCEPRQAWLVVLRRPFATNHISSHMAATEISLRTYMNMQIHMLDIVRYDSSRNESIRAISLVTHLIYK